MFSTVFFFVKKESSFKTVSAIDWPIEIVLKKSKFCVLLGRKNVKILGFMKLFQF